MRKIITTRRFEKDYVRAFKRGKDMAKLDCVITLLAEGAQLPVACRDHALHGDYHGHRDCHVESDWLLIYRISGNSLILERTGSHADLFA